MTPTAVKTQSHSRLLEIAAVVLLALAVRGAAATAQLDELSADPDAYRALAVRLHSTGHFARGDESGGLVPTAYRPPLYPLVLAALCSGRELPDSRVAVLHVVLGAATAAGTFLLARRLNLHSGAWAAAVLVIVDPLLLKQSWLVMTETLAAALTIVALAALVLWSQKASWPRALCAGLTLGLCILCRPTYLVWLGLVVPTILVLSLARRKASWPWWHGLVLAAAAGMVVAPWGIRNALAFGKPIVTTTHGGYTLLLGNNPYFYRYLHEQWWSDAWRADEFHRQWLVRRQEALASSGHASSLSPQRELAEEQAAYQWARESIAAAPGDFCLACLYRWWQLVNPLPSRLDLFESVPSALARYSVALWYLGIYLLVGVGLRRWRSATRYDFGKWALTLLAAFALIHTFYWTNLRMRAPLMPAFYIVAGMGIEQVLRKKWDESRLASEA